MRRLLKALALLLACQLPGVRTVAAPDQSAYRGFEINLEHSLAAAWIMQRQSRAAGPRRTTVTFTVFDDGHWENVNYENGDGCGARSAMDTAERVLPPPGSTAPIQVTAVFAVDDATVHCTAQRIAPAPQQNPLQPFQQQSATPPASPSVADPLETVVHSVWTNVEPSCNGTVDSVWVSAGGKAANLANGHGIMIVRNDNRYLYLGVETLSSSVPTERQTREEVRLLFYSRVGGVFRPGLDYAVTANCLPFTNSQLWKQYQLGTSSWSKAIPCAGGTAACRYRQSAASAPPHRIWTVRIPLSEISAKPGEHIGIIVEVGAPHAADAVVWPTPGTAPDAWATLELAKPG